MHANQKRWVAPLGEAIWQNLIPQRFDMNKLPHSICEVYDERGRLEGCELPRSHLPKNRYKTY